MSANCVPIHRGKPRSAKQPRVASSSSDNRIRPGRKVQPLRVPPGKIIKAQAMLAEGHSQREVSRELHMSGHSVAKIIRSEDFQNFIRQQRESLFAIAPLALESVRAGVMTDSRLAYVFLKDLGIIPSREAMVNMMTPGLTEAETGIERQARMIGHLMLEGNATFGMALPTNLEDASARESGEATQSAKRQPKLLRK